MTDLKQLKTDVQGALKKKDWSQGIELLAQWCALRPDDPRGWYFRGYFLLKLGRVDEAEKAVRQSLRLKEGQDDAESLLKLIQKQAETIPVEKPAPSPRSLWRPGKVIGGRYEVKDSKKGGMGEVFFAYDRELERMVAIKAPHASLLENEAQKSRFHREAEAWMGLGIHPNICSAYYLREIRGIPWLFIEYVGGGTLGDWMKTKNPSLGQKLDTAAQIASGMRHTHTFFWRDDDGSRHRGVVHRDLKPANILMNYDGTAKITDFGLVGRVAEGGAPDPERLGMMASRGQDTIGGMSGLGDTLDREIVTDVNWQTITLAGMALGTPPYMAPEQWQQAHAAGFPADVYAFGCLMYDIFCGRRPFQLDSTYRHAMPVVKLMQWEKIHLEQPPPDPREFTPEIPAILAECMLRCMAKAPEDRPGSFQEIRETLIRTYLETEGKPYPRPEPRASRLLADSLNNQGVSFMTIGQTRRAEAAWREALKTDPHHLEASFNAAMFEARYKEATYEDVFRRMMEVGRTHGNERRHKQVMGRLSLYFGDYGRAASFLLQSERVGESNPRELKHLGLALAAEAGPSADPLKWKQVEDLFTRVMEQGHEDPAVITARSLAIRRLSRPAEADTFYDWASRRFGDMPRSWREAVHRYLPGQEIIDTILHVGWVNMLTFNPDGRMVLCGGEKKISAWDILETAYTSVDGGFEAGLDASATRSAPLELADIQTGKTLREMQIKESLIHAMRLSPDGRWALTGNSEGEVRLWELETGHCLQTFTGHAGEVVDVAFSPDLQSVLTGGADGTARLWDVHSGRAFEVFEGHRGRLVFVGFNPDGLHAVTAGEDGTIRLWDSYDGHAVHVFEGSSDRISTAALSPDGRFVATVGQARVLRIWDTEDRIQRHSLDFLEGRAGPVAFTPDGKKLLVGDDRVLRVVDVKSGRLEKNFKIGQRVEALTISPDGRLVALVHANTQPPNTKTICLMEFISQQRYKIPFMVTLPISSLVADERETDYLKKLEEARAASGEERWADALAALGRARKVPGYERDPEALDLWADLASRYPYKSLRTGWEVEVYRGHRGPVRSLAISRKATLLLTGGDDGDIRLWDVREGTCLRVLPGHAGPVNGLGFYHDDRFAVSAGEDQTVRFWDLGSGSCLRVHQEHTGPVTCLAVGPDGLVAATGGQDTTIRVWNLFSRICVKSWAGHKGPVVSLGFNPDGRYLLSSGRDKTIRLWDVADGTQDRLIHLNIRQANQAAISPDGRIVVAACDDSLLRSWSLTAEEMPEILGGHAAEATTLAICPDGQYAVSGGQDRTVRLWDLKTGQALGVFESHSAPVTTVVISANRQRVFSAGLDHTARLWHLDWEPDYRDVAPWSEGVRPYLDAFLTLKTPYSKGSLTHVGRPRWTPNDFDDLLREITWRGYGWLSPKGVAQELKKMANARKTPLKYLIGEFLSDLADVITRHLGPLRFLAIPLRILFKLAPAALMTVLLLTQDFMGLPTPVGLLIIAFLILVAFAKKK